MELPADFLSLGRGSVIYGKVLSFLWSFSVCMRISPSLV